MKKIGVVMLNMGGPADLSAVRPFLSNLFKDADLIQSNSFLLRNLMSRLIVNARSHRVTEQYKAIGGGSPILSWTDFQGRRMTELLNSKLGHKYFFKHYVAFRYAHPGAKDALLKLKADGVEHAIAFSQYPQYSCTTTGSSLNDIWRNLKTLELQNEFKWSLIDRWPTNEFFVGAVTELIEEQLAKFDDPAKAVIVFSAHSLPIKTVNRGDQYVHEVHRTISAVMERLREKRFENKYVAAWQSKVGPVAWQGPQTESVLKSLGERGFGKVVIVPIAFTSDHIETLYEIDVEYRKVAEESGITEFRRSRSLNDSEMFCRGLAEMVEDHLREKKVASAAYGLRCADCWQGEKCRKLLNPAF